MKKAIMQSKWRWYIPVISFFFIEEQAEWANTTKDDRDKYMRTMLITSLLAINVTVLILSVVFYYFNN